jgi:hypothetical protein
MRIAAAARSSRPRVGACCRSWTYKVDPAHRQIPAPLNRRGTAGRSRTSRSSRCRCPRVALSGSCSSRPLVTWTTSREVDYLDVRLDLLPGRTVALSGQPAPARSITAEEYFAIEIDDAQSAAGIALPPNREVDAP